MRLATIATETAPAVLVAAVPATGGDVLVALAGAHARRVAATGGEAGAASLPDDMRLLLEGGDASLEAARAALAHAERALSAPGGAGEWRAAGLLHDPATVTFLPPVARPGKIISIGVNYRDHVAEVADEVPTEADPDFPPAFAKFASTLVGHEHPVVHSRHTTQLDYEAELCVVIGKRCRDVPAEAHLDVVAGFSNFNDVSMRDTQLAEMKRGTLLLGKNLDTTAPIGPYLVTKDEIPDPEDLEISCWVNGERRQHSRTSQMIFGLGAIIARYSRLTLEPGDLITTGTPAGVALGSDPSERRYLRPGDVVEVEIEGLGRLRNPIVADAG
jgi:acylpyruvate hydrolase